MSPPNTQHWSAPISTRNRNNCMKHVRLPVCEYVFVMCRCLWTAVLIKYHHILSWQTFQDQRHQFSLFQPQTTVWFQFLSSSLLSSHPFMKINEVMHTYPYLSGYWRTPSVIGMLENGCSWGIVSVCVWGAHKYVSLTGTW